MNRKIFVTLLILIVVLPITSFADKQIDYINYNISNDTLITQIAKKNNINELVDIKNYLKIDSLVSRNTNLTLDNFDKNDKYLKDLIPGIDNNIKLLEIPYFTVLNGSEIKTLDKNIFITADYLNYSNNLFSHKNEYLFMNGKVILKHTDKKSNIVLEQREITTLEEYKMLENNSLNKDYWNLIEYEKGGNIKLSENGYYLVSVRDNNKNIIDTIVLKVVNKDSVKNIDFPDVSKNAWYYKGVIKAVNTGIVVGRDDGNFDPNGNLTIAEAITLSARARSRYEGEQFFEGGLRWYDNAVNYAVKNNVIQIGDFIDYNKYATREEMSYIFANTMPKNYYKKEISTLPKDIENSKYKNSIILLYNSNILKGRDDGNFDPKSKITRAESAVIINRLVNR